jgi:hypothetical protein
MIRLNPFRFTLSHFAAVILARRSKQAHDIHREKVRAKARAIREAFGLPPSEALR